MTKAKKAGNRHLSNEELNQLRNKAYWTNPHKLKVASTDPMVYPRSLWRKIEEFHPQIETTQDNRNE